MPTNVFFDDRTRNIKKTLHDNILPFHVRRHFLPQRREEFFLQQSGFYFTNPSGFQAFSRL